MPKNSKELIAQSPIVTYFKAKRSNRKAKTLAKANIKKESCSEHISDEGNIPVKKGPKKVLPKIENIEKQENKENLDPKVVKLETKEDEIEPEKAALPAGCNKGAILPENVEIIGSKTKVSVVKKINKPEVTSSPPKKSKKSKKSIKKLIKVPINQPKISDFFSISGRPKRVPASQLKKEEDEVLYSNLNYNFDEKLEYLVVKLSAEKGRGVYAKTDIKSGSYIVEYAGELMSQKEGKIREEKYSLDPTIGSYIYFFEFKGNKYCIDATQESGRYGRLLNHSCKIDNCKMKRVEYPEGTPRLILEAKRDIAEGEELLYNYGDKSAKSLKVHPWLAL